MNRLATVLRVLLVEDSENDAHLVLRALSNGGYEVAHQRVDNAEALRAALNAEQWDLMLSDHNMQGFDALEALEIRRKHDLDLPFIIVSGSIGEQAAVEAMRSGASDYVTKDNLARLIPVVQRELKEAQARAGLRRAEEALSVSEERFRSLTALSSDWYWEQDKNYRFIRQGVDAANKEHVPPGATAGTERWNNPTANLSAEEWSAHRAVLDARQPFHDLEYSRLGVNGDRRWVSVSGEPVFDGTGEFKGYRGVGKDITDRKCAEQELDRFRQAMDVSVDSIYLTDASLRFVYVNETACRRSNLSREQLLRMGPHEILGTPAEQVRSEYALAISAGPKGIRLELPAEVADGTQRWVEIHRRALFTGEGTYVLAIVRDITERKNAEKKISRLNRVYAVLSDINALIARVKSRDDLFNEVCRIAVDTGGLKMSWIGIVDSERSHVEPRAWEGADEAYMRAIPTRLSGTTPLEFSLTGRAVMDLMPVVSQDVANDGRILLKEEAIRRGFRSMAALPLSMSGEALGVLMLCAGEVGYFDAEEMKLLTGLAGDISFALEHIRKSERLDYLAFYDELTGLANRTLFQERLDQFAAEARTKGGKLSLLLMDVERFRMVNDALGRQAGDDLLRQLARRLESVTGQPGRLARVGGDVFGVITTGLKTAEDMARRVQSGIPQLLGVRFRLGEVEQAVSARFGIAMFPDDGGGADALFKSAEAALEKAKAKGERYVFFTQAMTSRVAERLELENRLRLALEKEEFVLHYQPKVDLQTRAISGVEALIRWKSPEHGLVPPLKFIPLLEETGLIVEVGAWALRRAALDHKTWVGQGLSAPRVAVNVSAVQLRRPDFVAGLQAAIEYGASEPGLDLEVTESLIMEDIEGSIEKLKAARALGISIAIDDFGTGYSSLAYLARLPVQTLKIDRTFIIAMLEDPNVTTLVQTMISLAHSLRLKVVAEGVEEEEQAMMLRLLRCEEMQGYLFSKPLPLEEMTALLRAQAPIGGASHRQE
jgi:diguanylate cyclase (GGDEF)-like protein/PAS domain S-box-containing protein